MSVINTNITSMIGQANLQKSQSALQTSMERLSSGLRINSAKDDAAGQAIANRMTAQITGLAQAQRNANDGISVAQTAEGALNQVNDNLQRIRELSVQAQNDTNSANDLQSIQDEIGQRLSEIDRISQETDFNGVKVLNTNEGVSIQVGANDNETISVNLQTINAETLGLSSFSIQKAADVELSDEVTTIGGGDKPAGEATANSFTFEGVALSGTPTVGAGESFDSFVQDDTSGAVYAKVEYDGEGTPANAETRYYLVDTTDGAVVANDGTVTLNTSSLTADATGSLVGGESAAGPVDITKTLDDGSALTLATGYSFEEYVTDDAGQLYAKVSSDTTSEVNYFAIDAADIADNGTVAKDISAAAADFTSNEFAITADGTVPAGATLYEVEDAEGNGTGTYVADVGGELFAVDIDEVAGTYSIQQASYTDESGAAQTADVRFGGIDGKTMYAQVDVQRDGETVTANFAVNANQDGTFSVDLEKEIAVEGTANPLAGLDSALNKVDSLRSELGAIQNRFESAITNLQTNETNLSAARSRIEDADYAVEVANMTRAQILQQAGTSVLAQANQIPQNVLSLLG